MLSLNYALGFNGASRGKGWPYFSTPVGQDAWGERGKAPVVCFPPPSNEAQLSAIHRVISPRSILSIATSITKKF